MKKKLQKPYPTDYKVFIAEDIWQARYQVLLKEISKLNLNRNRMIKYVKFALLNTNITTAFLNKQTLKMI